MRLCLALGVQHPDHLLLSGQQLRDWQEFALVEPFGDSRDDARALAMISVMANVFAGRKDKSDKPFEPREFSYLLPTIEVVEEYKAKEEAAKNPPVQTEEEAMAQIQALINYQRAAALRDDFKALGKSRRAGVTQETT